ncbi:type II toxin-antitoxin system CcdA family antitoxin [Phaeobacter inhibens]|uniref:type II toxin-antitoxin system CcdA family antitoxin n=1 Tax=Phaeobacter inhibens TaxID=221822 RepID=UPI0020C7DFC2|nr:type II toxin-antitoxin system CcdA family antitoxin [Phaeobacter inhibens]
MESGQVVDARKQNTSLPVDAEVLVQASGLGTNVSTKNKTKQTKAMLEVRRQNWLDENAQVFSDQSDWHERNGHPLIDIIESPGGSTWSTDLP